MSQKIFDLILRADSKQLVTGFDAARRGVQAFNREAGSGSQAIAMLTGHINTLIGAFVGMSAISRGTEILKAATTAAFSMENAITASNREFSNTGSMSSWGSTLDDLSQKLRIYSKTELSEAIAKTVDMTKRQGLSEQQMRLVIERTGDLAAGHMSLESAIERTSSAIRGEAEAAEALGLSIGEVYTKSWYEARGAMQGAWKDLTDNQKAQIRFRILLEQTESKIGSAALSIQTLGGALQFVNARLQDSVANNKNLVDASKELAIYIAENADKIGDLAAGIANAAGEFLKFVLEHKDGIATMAKVTLLLVGLNKAGGLLMTTYNGIQAATVAVTGSRLLPWLTGATGTMTAGTTAANAMSLAMRAIPFIGAAWGATKIYELAKTVLEWRDASNQAEESQKRLAESERKLADKLRQISQDTGITISSFQELQKAAKDGIISLDNATGQWRKNTEEQKNTVLQLTQQTGQAYDTLADKARNVAGAVTGANATITGGAPSSPPAPFVSTMDAATPSKTPATTPAPGINPPTSPADPATVQQATDNYNQIADAAENSADRQEKAMSSAASGMISSLTSFVSAGKDQFGDLENKMKSMSGGLAVNADQTPEERLAAMKESADAMQQQAKEMLGDMNSSNMAGMMGGMSMDMGSMLSGGMSGGGSFGGDSGGRSRRRKPVDPTQQPTADQPTYTPPSTDHNRLVQVNGEWRNVSDADIVQNKIQKERMKSGAEADAANIANNQRLSAPQDPSGGKGFSTAAQSQRGPGGAPVEKIHKIDFGDGAQAYTDDEDQADKVVKRLNRMRMMA